MEAGKVGDAIDAQQHGFAVDNKMVRFDPPGTFRDERITAAPVVSIAGPEAHALALPLNDQAVAVMLHSMQPIRM